ncbi:MAG: Na(+)/H(+) antiporter subunit B [Paenibacillus macerans]|uniref:Na(+)/H(+) antiporter subunit B n=1 Tax=Paenibacillus macerans TaxID=44252 RepID=A0A090ZNV9_PAEMA|nr:Na(+)/H(+) antiporter subunit B [Paenibacillus macerans]KFN11955.1 na(+)/H(+) antiporter subunit B [Paenibacillus macerans]MBS5910359.1 Na(+)/H(+) antiporter subunit B [Paenibacillus macerans]MCY7562284.1 Na(+)/H(+) antiporter subunit B [Paenibacillus macerans]MDU5948132.1 Na(+)/H(+) antiporter subunit B [Paenibacillus macerans]MDU7471868.1 Na(+)/H(+) antiporter subunit B [Paenibacillus macerans]
MKPNNVILKSVTRVAVVIIFTFSIYLFLNGHHQPGGGFIGGLSTAAAIVLLYLSFGIEKVRENIRIDFKKLAAIGVLIAVGTGMAGAIFGKPFLFQIFGHVDLPIFGDTELASAMIFDTGVALAVIGTAVVIILGISEDR